ncbi:MAG: hypothetical protein KGL39_33720 [Patescibacteria group bacterium]|nr:hypothetical protein [Patescibacteria group bacterium]
MANTTIVTGSSSDNTQYRPPDDTTPKGLDELLRQARSARARLEPEWYLNLAFFQNLQWLAWDGRQLYKPALRANRITIVDNRITGAVRTEVAKMTKSRPIFTAVPNSPDTEDLNAAELADQLMIFAWDHLKLLPLATKALLWSRITGSGFLKCYWDSSIGDRTTALVGPDGKVLQDPQTGAPLSPQLAPALAQQGINAKVQTVAQGDIRVEVRSPFQMFPDPLADSFEEAEWTVEESVKSTEYVQRRYDVMLKPDAPANPGLIEARMGMSYTPGASGYKGVRVKEYWRKPCPKHPDGYRAVWAQGKILFQDEKPHDPMPYVMLTGIQVPGRMWPTSVAELLRGPQTELNKVKSQIAENRNRIGNPTMLASKQAVQDPENFNRSVSQPGSVYYYDDTGSPNAVPTYLQAPPLPDYVIQEIQNIEEAIQEISGQHDVSSAQVPPGVTAASAIQLLQEADDTRLGPSMFDYEQQLGHLGQKVLKLIARYYTDQRTIRIAGNNGAWQIFDFQGAMLKGNTHVKVQAGSALPQSKAAKQAMAQDLLNFLVQSGNAPKGRELAQFLQAWDIGGADKLIADYTRDETQVNRENVLLAQGRLLPINDFDDDQAHIDGHTDFQKQPHYPTLPPQVQKIFEAHVNAHRARQHDQQMTQLQLQMEVEGTTPPNLTQPALQNAQQLSQMDPNDFQAAQLHLQGAQQGLDMQGQAGQQQQQLAGQQAQQITQLSGQQAQQRQAEEKHQQQMRHAEEMHQANLARARQQPQQKAA